MQFDERKLASIMSDIGALYEKTYTTQQVGIWYRILAKKGYAWEQVVAGIQAHTEDPTDGKFAPKPAHVIAQIEKAAPGDGRIDADEAWSICLESMDEGATVCVTDEIMVARAIAIPIYEDGDRVGARMAFRAAYERAVGQARHEYRPAKWLLSLGHDADGREHAIRMAVEALRITTDEAKHLLPPPKADGVVAEIAGLIAGKKVVKLPRANDEVSRQRIAALRDALGMSESKAGPMATPVEEAQARVDADESLRSRGAA